MKSRPFNKTDLLNWLQLIQSENIGPKTFYELLNHFGDAALALEAAPELSRRGGAKRAIKICPRDKAEAWLERLETYGARLIAYGDTHYPTALAHIDTPPPLICMKGRIELAQRPVISIVGSRNASAIGLKLARNFAADIGKSGISICSGLARGIDTAVHQASIATGTIAVLAGGIDHIYPPENDKLHEEIAQDGLLISEMMPGTQPQAQFFPRRNRIISGISHGVLVVEAAKRSGSLITARFAAEQGRDVFALPGSILDPRASGTNHLIQNGAILALKPEDIIEALSLFSSSGFYEKETGIVLRRDKNGGLATSVEKISPAEVSPKMRDKVISLLSTTPIDLDVLIRESGEKPALIHLALLELELANRLMRHSGNQISLI